jgi:hypothetical protein
MHDVKSKRTIFRTEAVQRYIENRERAVLPRFVTPRTFLCLWLLLGLLVASGIVTWFTPIPVYASGPAIVVASRDDSAGTPDEVLVVAFIPAEHLPYVQVGQRLFVHLDAVGQPLHSSVVDVEPELISPAAARQRFTPDGGAALSVSQPAAVVMARLHALPGDMPTAIYSGSIGHVDVEVGSRRVLSLVPWIGQIGEST